MSIAILKRKDTPDLTGQQFGRLTVLNPERTDDNKLVWRCRCSCAEATEVVRFKSQLTQPKNPSCGCVLSEQMAEFGRAKKLDRVRSAEPEYHNWSAMVYRCPNPESKDYAKYGAVGITVCGRWLDYDSFLEDVGRQPTPEHTLDRYPNREGNYEPGNVRWATAKQQAENRSTTKWEECFGVTLTRSDWGRLTGLNVGTISDRIDNRGWSVIDALTTPPKHGPHVERFVDPRPILTAGWTSLLFL